jgi:dihydropteroate synthase
MAKEPRSVQVVVYRETDAGRRYLVLLRRREGSPDFWQPVSGSLEPGETFAQAAARELYEESGISDVESLRDLGLVNSFRIAPAWRPLYAPDVTHNLQVAFGACVTAGEVRIDPREHAEHRWEPYARARELMHYEPNRRAIDLVEHGEERAVRRRFRLELDRRAIDLGARTLVMGVLNVTPDSFSDGGRYADLDAAVDRALEMEAEGADLLDVGGESSRPGAQPVTQEDERRRVVPVVEALAHRLKIPISVDTTRAETARAAIEAGAEILNDISALRFDAELAAVAARAKAGLVLMHMRGTPETMQRLAPSDDILAEVERDLLAALDVAADAGVDLARIVVDPGVGFGKTVAQNVELIARLDRLARLDRPVLVGTSRKSFLGRLTGRDTSDRLAGSLASITAAVLGGAHVVRVHDVAPSVDAVRVADAVLDQVVAGGQNRVR